jgi:outer membrane murein-binding lipoprotein Lpp
MRDLIIALIEAITYIAGSQRQQINVLTAQSKRLEQQLSALEKEVKALSESTGVVLLDNDIKGLLANLKTAAAAPNLEPVPVADDGLAVSTGFDPVPEVKQ